MVDMKSDSLATQISTTDQRLALVFWATIAIVLGCLGLIHLGYFAVFSDDPSGHALGATKTNVFASVLRDGFKPVLIGLCVGLLGASMATRLIANKLYGVSPLDPVTFIVAALAMVIVAFIACCVPAWKAARADPMEELRYE